MLGDSIKLDHKMSNDDKMKPEEMGAMGMKVSSMKMMAEHYDMSK